MLTVEMNALRVNKQSLNWTYRLFCNKPKEMAPSAAMDNLVKNLQTKLHLSKQTKQSSVHLMPDTSLTSKPRPNLPKAFSESAECDASIRDLLDRKCSAAQIVPVFHKFATNNKFPSRKTLVIIAKVCADERYIEGVRAVRDVCEVAYPLEASWQMRYRHYEAEAIWKQGNCEEALKIFQELFAKNPYQRRKLANMSTFLMRHVLINGLTEHYPKLVTFVDGCLGFGDPVPAANLWRAAFSDASYEANVLAEDLLIKRREAIFGVVAGKVPAILKEAKDFKLVDLMQRLMQFVLNYDLKEHHGAVFGTYMDYLCDDNDVNRALETFQFISKSSIIIPAESVHKLLELLALNKKKLPSFLLQNSVQVNNAAESVPTNFQF